MSPVGVEVMLIDWDFTSRRACLVKKYRVHSTGEKILPWYICQGDDVFKRLLDTKLYAKI